MPHLIIEHCKKLESQVELPKLCSSVHKVLASQETVKLEAIKTRSIRVDNVIVGDETDNSLLCVTLLLLKGRDDELKTKMAKDIHATCMEHVSSFNCSVTVNVDELGVYIK